MSLKMKIIIGLLCALVIGFLVWHAQSMRSQVKLLESEKERLEQQKIVLEQSIKDYQGKLEAMKEQSKLDKEALALYLEQEKELERELSGKQEELEKASEQDKETYSTRVPDSEWRLFFGSE